MPELRFNKKSVFTLLMCIVWAVPAIPHFLAQDSADLLSGEPIQAMLSDDMLEMRYDFAGQQGAHVTASLSSRSFDALLRIEDADGNEVTSNDDANGSLNASIDDFILPEDSDYTLVVTSSDGSGTGEFTLTFMSAPVQKLTYGDSIDGELTSATHFIIYEFEGKRGDLVSALLESSEFDSYLTLLQEYEMTSDDDSGGNHNALIGAYSLPESGTYYLKVSSFSVNPVGQFTVSLNKVEANPVSANKPVKGHIDNDILYYSFDGKNGDRVSVRVQSDGMLDTVMNLKSTQGYSIGYDDDSGYGYDPELNDLILSEDGRFIIVLAPASAQASGDFTLTVLVDKPAQLSCDSQTRIEFSTKITQSAYVIDAKGRSTVTLDFTAQSGDTSSLSVNASENGEYITSGYGSYGETELTMDVTAPYTGSVLFVMYDYFYNLHTYQLDVTCSS